MGDLLGPHHSPKGGARAGTQWFALPQFAVGLRDIVQMRRVKSFAIVEQKVAELSVAQMRMAFASIASNTGFKSPGEEEMALRTSDVAVCCSRAFESSRVRACTSSNSRVFSMAMTAWSAKVFKARFAGRRKSDLRTRNCD